MSQSRSRQNSRPFAAMMFRLPLMIDCVEFEGFIIDYLEGTLPKRKRILFDMHLKLCRECRDYLQAYKDTMSLTHEQMDKSFSQMGLGDVPEDLVTAILAARK